MNAVNAPSAPPVRDVRPVGELRLGIGLRAGRSMATRQFHQGALRVIRPHYLDDSGQVTYVIVNPGGGYLGGDRYGIDIEVDEGASLLLTTQSATKVYRTPNGHAQQDTNIRLGPGAVLEYLPDQLIAYRESTYRQRNSVHMRSDATLVMAEVVTPGWSPDGARFRFDEVRLRTDVYIDGRLEVLDHVLIRPGATEVEDMTFLGTETHVASLLVVDRRVNQELVRRLHGLLKPLDPRGLMGISLLKCPGFALRAQAGSTEDLNRIINTVVSALRQGWNGQGPIDLRKGEPGAHRRPAEDKGGRGS